MAQRNWRAQASFLLILIVLATALVLRVINLDADPSALISRDFITDEGQWSHNARNALVTGQLRLDDYNPGLYSAYLYHHLLRFAFYSFGISITSARLVSSLSGSLTVLLMFLWVRRETNTRTAIIATILLSFSNLHVLYSRTGFVESTMVFFLALTLWLWSMRQKHPAFSALSGIALGLMVMTKVTAIYVFPGFALLAASEAIRNTTRKRDLLLFLCGAFLVAVIYSGTFVIPNFKDWLSYNLAAGLDNEFPRHPADLIFSILRLLVWHFYARTPILTGLALVALSGFAVRITLIGLKAAIREASSIEVTSGTLLIGYLMSIGFTVYQPERRFVPVLFLMVPLSASVLNKGWLWFAALADEARLGAGAWFILLFSMPAVAILELKWYLIGSPMSIRSWLIKVLSIAAMALISIRLGNGLSSRLKLSLLKISKSVFILLFSWLWLGLVYQSLTLWGVNANDADSAKFVVSVVFVAAGLAAIAALKFKVRPAAVILVAFLSIELLQVSTWLLQPTYTVRQASDALVSLINEGQTVVTHYETVLVSSSARTVCYLPKAGFNIDAFERYQPDYILILRRDNWIDYALVEMPADEWPPPSFEVPAMIARFDLCPTPRRGYRFSLELYRLVRSDRPQPTLSVTEASDPSSEPLLQTASGQ